jgi:hypothetical protein
LLASIATEDAIKAGVRKSNVEQAQRFLDRGDAVAGKNVCGKALEDYRKAWKSLNGANIPTGSGAN